jgi:hypothetical protein
VPRGAKRTFRSPPLADLLRQLKFAPPQRRIEQVHRAEQLHDQIDPALSYPLEFLTYRITGYRAESAAPAVVAGAAALPDLRLLIDRLSRSVAMPDDPADPVEHPAVLAAELGVSTRTLARWRARGLRWRWVAAADPTPAPAPGARGGKFLGYPRSAVQGFLTRHEGLVRRAAHFTQLDAGTRQDLLQRARRLARSRRPVSFNQVAAHLARRSGRAIETIRMLLAKYDREHPHDPIFADHHGPLDTRQKRLIVRAYGMGIAAVKIARRLRRSRSTIYRVLHERRGADLARRRYEGFTLPSFTRSDADEVFLGGPDAPLWSAAAAPLAGPDADLPEALRALFHQPQLEPERQQALLIRMNYLKFKAQMVRGQLGRYDPRGRDLDLLESLLSRAAAIRAHLVALNLPVVLATARRHLTGPGDDTGVALLHHLEAGVEVVAAAVDGCDISRGVVLEAYLTWLLMRRFAATLPHHAEEPGPQTGGTGPRAHRREDVPALVQRVLARAAALGIATE